jgi:hypothetical protein
MNIIPTKELALETFLPHVKSKFRVLSDGGQPVDLELAEAAGVAGAHGRVPNKNGMVQEVFSLMFDGPEQPVLPQRCHAVEHEKIGRFELFIVPVEKISGGIRYQVLFNRLVKAA